MYQREKPMDEKEYAKARGGGAKVIQHNQSHNNRGRGKLTRRGLGNIWNEQLKRLPKRDGNFITRDEAHATYREIHEQKKQASVSAR